MKKYIIVKVDGKESARLSVKEAKEKASVFSPLSHSKENTFYKESEEIRAKIRNPSHYNYFDLKELIAFLQEVYSKFGNMPILYFNGSENIFSRPALSDIDIIKSYFIIRGNLGGTTIEIKNQKALSFFHA